MIAIIYIGYPHRNCECCNTFFRELNSNSGHKKHWCYSLLSIVDESWAISRRLVEVGESIVLSIICFHLSIFLFHTGLGGYSLSTDTINVAILGEIFTGWPSGPAIVIYFFTFVDEFS